MSKTIELSSEEIIELRQQVNYWKTRHQRAVEREKQLREIIEQQARTIREQAGEVKELKTANEKLRAELSIIKKMLFGDKQEKKRKAKSNEMTSSDSKESNDQKTKRNRGQQPGAKGHGRSTHDHLPTEEKFHDLNEEEKRSSL